MLFQAFGKSDKGLVRPNNEDCFCVSDSPPLYIVADGIGGYAAGEIASQIAIDATLDQIKKTGEPLELPFETDIDPLLTNSEKRLSSIIQLTNHIIYQAAQGNVAWRGMGTTIAVVWPTDIHKITIGHVGDSRIYLFRRGAMTQLTKDHSIIEEQISKGLLSKEEAEHSEIKNFITRALGHEPNVQVDVKEVELRNDDIILLCTDGLTSMLTDDIITSLVHPKEKLATICDKLIKAANGNGGRDNITIILAHYQAKAT